MPYAQAAKADFQKVIDHLSSELNTIRTGRATPAILETVQVESYGSFQPVKAVASISIPDAKTLMIEPWDPSMLKHIETAIMKSDVGITPNVDGKVIRLIMPAMTDESRQRMVKLMKEKLEDARVAVRRVREELKKTIEKEAGSDDEKRSELASLETTVKEWTGKVEEMGKKKEQEITTI